MSTLADIYVHNIDPIIVAIPHTPLAVRWYGLAYVAGFILGYWVLLKLAEKKLYCIEPKKLSDFITMVCLFGVLMGARLGEFFFYWLPEHGLAGLWADPLWVLRVWEGGMASHGGIIAVLIVAIIYSVRHKLSIAGVCDGLAIVSPIGLFFGRVANFVNGELYGRPCSPDNPLAMKFPQELMELSPEQQAATLAHLEQVAGAPLAALRATTEDGQLVESIPDVIMRLTRTSEPFRQALGEHLTPRYPSQLFEALGEGLIIFVVLITLRLLWRKAPDGVFCALFAFLYAAARITSECFKEPDAPTWGIITRGQYLSFAVIAVGLVFLVVALRNRKRSASPAA